MIQPHSQGAEATLEELSPILPLVYRSVEAAVQEASEFFGDSAIDRPLFPNLVRYYVKRALQRRGLNAVEDDAPQLEHKILPNNGLFLEYGARRIRILKSDNGGLPAPGISAAKQQFYEQLSLLEEPIDVQNLIILWDVEDGLLGLQLVCPKHGSERTSSVHWTIAIPHPANTVASPESAEEPFEFDLPISLPEAASDDE